MKSEVHLNMNWSGQIFCFVYVCLCVRQKRRAVIGLLRLGCPVNGHLPGSWAFGSWTGLRVEKDTDPTISLSPPTPHSHAHTYSPRSVLPLPVARPWLVPTPTVTDSSMFTGFSGNLDRKSISLHFQIFIFKSTLCTVYLCPTTSQLDLFCCNLKQASPFPKIKHWKCLEECKPNEREIIQIQIAVSS